VEIYNRAEQATDDNMARAHCMLDTQGYKHTHRMYNSYCFSTATVVARTRLHVTLYVNCLSCYILKYFRFHDEISVPWSCNVYKETCSFFIIMDYDIRFIVRDRSVSFHLFILILILNYTSILCLLLYLLLLLLLLLFQ